MYYSVVLLQLGPNPGIAGLLGMQGNLLSPDLADMLFKTAAAATAAPMSVTGDHSCQEYCSSPYQQQQSMSRQ